MNKSDESKDTDATQTSGHTVTRVKRERPGTPPTHGVTREVRERLPGTSTPGHRVTRRPLSGLSFGVDDQGKVRFVESIGDTDTFVDNPDLSRINFAGYFSPKERAALIALVGEQEFRARRQAALSEIMVDPPDFDPPQD